MLECKYMVLSHGSEVLYRINRYMLECKSESEAVFFMKRIELIDTCWNVNVDSCVD